VPLVGAQSEAFDMAGVRTAHRDYDRLLPLWQQCRDIVAGQSAMHARGEEYLPMLAGEDRIAYLARLKRSDLFNATWRTIAGLSGMAFRKEPARDLPTLIERYSNDITMSGINLDALAENLVEEVLEVGRIGLLVDHPTLPEGVTAITQDAAERLGMRPFLTTYRAEAIRNWKYARVGNRWVMVQVVLGEQAEVPKDEFENELVDRYRVLDLDEAGQYRQRVFEVRDGIDVLVEGPLYPQINGNAMSYIPFQILGRSGKGDEIDEPPLIDLVDANVAHYQLNSDYRHGLHFTAMPTLFLAGVTDDDTPFYIGGQAAITSQHPDAKGMFIEYTGQGLGAISTALKELEQRMALLGARMIADETRQAETLGATQIKRVGENSILARICIVTSEAMEWALGVMAEWAGASGEVTYQISREFNPLGLSAQDLTALFSGVQAGIISEAEAFDLLQRGDVVDGKKSFEEHQEEIGQQGPATPDPVRPDSQSMAA
jgi:hypothetical protein